MATLLDANKDSLPGSGDELVARVDTLPYDKRMKYAAGLARRHKASPQLRALISDLRKTPLSADSSVVADEEFMKLFPPAQRDTPNNYHRHQMALTMAAVSKSNGQVLREELAHPCVAFDQFVVKEIVADPVDADAELLALIRSDDTSPKIRKKVLSQCMRQGKFALLDSVYAELHSKHGPEFAIRILHACSDATVRKYLPAFADQSTAFRIAWEKFCSYHPTVVLDLMEKDVAAESFENRAAVYLEWYNKLTQGTAGRGVHALYYNAGKAPQVFAMYVKYPCGSARGGWTSYHYPPFILNFWSHMCKVVPDQVEAFLRGSMSRHHSTVVSSIPAQFWDKNSLPFKNKYAVIKYALDLERMSPEGQENRHGNDIVSTKMGTWLNYLSANQTTAVTVLVKEYCMRMRPPPVTAPKVQSPSRYLRWANRAVAFYSIALKRLAHRSARAQKMAGDRAGGRAYRVALSTVLTHLLTFFEEYYYDNRPQACPMKDFYNSQHSTGAQKMTTVVKRLKDFPELVQYCFQRNYHFWMAAVEGRKSKHCVSFWTMFDIYVGEALTSGSDAVEEAKARQDPKLEERAKSLLSTIAKAVMSDVKTAPTEAFALATRAVQSVVPADVMGIFHAVGPGALLQYATFESSRNRTRLRNVNTFLDCVCKAMHDKSLAEDFTSNMVALQSSVVALSKRDVAMLDPLHNYNILAFLDIRVAENRARLTQDTDAGSEEHRQAHIWTLVRATRNAYSPAEFATTLAFLVKKCKNAKAEERQNLLDALMDVYDEEPELVVSSQAAPLWFELLQDALEARDTVASKGDYHVALPKKTDEPVFPLVAAHPILAHFRTLSLNSLDVGVDKGNINIINFAFEIQWRIEKFFRGDGAAKASFQVEFSDKLNARGFSRATYWPKSLPSVHHPVKNCFPNGAEGNFLKAVLDAYKARVADVKPAFDKDPAYLTPIINVLGTEWDTVPDLVALVDGMFDAVSGPETKKDKDGVALIDHDHPAVLMFHHLSAFYGHQWAQNGRMLRYAEVLLRSYQGPRLLRNWLAKKINPGKKRVPRAERRRLRVEAAQALLDISPSAIHIRFVWRHLLRYRQDLLDPFLVKQEAFRGVYYVPPALRVPVARKGRRVPDAIMDEVDRRVNRVLLSATGTPELRIVVLEIPPTSLDDVLEAEAAAQEAVEEALAEGAVDHPDFFVLEAVYGLRRMLPRQVQKLAAVQQDIYANKDRGMPDRVKALQRWTLYPTTAFADVIKALDGNEKALGVNLVEALLKGVLLNDEPCSALPYLMTPAMLGSDRARISAFALRSVMSVIGEKRLTKLFNAVLSGERQRALKVTAYKEVMRLLVVRLTPEHCKMLRREWNRPNLHRDVRIAIAQQSIDILRGGNEDGRHDLAWEILESAVEKYHECTELMIALMCASPHGPPSLSVVEAVCLKGAKLVEYIEALGMRAFPIEFSKRYFEKVLLPVVGGTVPVEDDARHIGVFSLRNFLARSRSECHAVAFPVLHSLLADLSEEKFATPMMDVRTVHINRWKQALEDVLATGGGIPLAAAEAMTDLMKTRGAKNRTVRSSMFILADHLICQYLNACRQFPKDVAAAFKSTGLYDVELMRQEAQTVDRSRVVDFLDRLFLHAAVNGVPAEYTSICQYLANSANNNVVDTLSKLKDAPADATPDVRAAYRRIKCDYVLTYLSNSYYFSYCSANINADVASKMLQLAEHTLDDAVAGRARDPSQEVDRCFTFLLAVIGAMLAYRSSSTLKKQGGAILKATLDLTAEGSGDLRSLWLDLSSKVLTSSDLAHLPRGRVTVDRLTHCVEVRAAAAPVFLPKRAPPKPPCSAHSAMLKRELWKEVGLEEPTAILEKGAAAAYDRAVMTIGVSGLRSGSNSTWSSSDVPLLVHLLREAVRFPGASATAIVNQVTGQLGYSPPHKLEDAFGDLGDAVAEGMLFDADFASQHVTGIILLRVADRYKQYHAHKPEHAHGMAVINRLRDHADPCVSAAAWLISPLRAYSAPLAPTSLQSLVRRAGQAHSCYSGLAKATPATPTRCGARARVGGGGRGGRGRGRGRGRGGW